MSIIVNLLLLIDGLLYSTIDWLFDIFMFLTKANLFSNDMYADIVRRIYIVLGLVMMFALAYSLLKAVINPDEFSKGENSFPKLVKNVIVSLAIIAILPTVFTVAFNIQNSILNQDTIPKLVLGEEYDSSKYSDAGRTIAYNSFAAFLHVNDEWCKQENKITDPTINLSEDELISCKEKINTNASNVKWYTPWRAFNTNANFKDISQQIEDGNLAFANFNQFGEAVVEGKLSYLMLLSTIFGLFLLYVIANFCFDMAVRVIKLMFFQIIAPIPVVCRVIPGGKMKDVFSTWTKKTISTFMDVFIRIFIMYLGIFIIITIVSEWDGITADTLTSTQLFVAKALVIMGVVIFMRQAPKLLSDMFHLDSGSMKLGLMDKLAMGGALTAGAVLGGGLGSLGKNAVSGFKNFHATKGEKWYKRAGSAAWGAASTVAGGASGAVRGGKGGLKAKNFGDVKKAAGSAVAGASAAKAKRDAYRASHKGVNPVDTLLGVGVGHIIDTATNVGEYFGINDGLKALQEEQAIYQEGLGFKKELFDLVADNENVLTYQGMKKTAQERDISNYVSEIEKGIISSGYSNKDNTGYYKLNNITGQKEYYKDSSGNVLNDLTGLAIAQKTADIKKYDDAIKLASLSAISEKISKGDGRFTAVLKKSEVWKAQHADNVNVSAMDVLKNLDTAQLGAINNALASNDASKIKEVIDAFEGDIKAMSSLHVKSLGIMANDKKLKVANGNAQDAIAEKIQEKKKEN